VWRTREYEINERWVELLKVRRRGVEHPTRFGHPRGREPEPILFLLDADPDPSHRLRYCNGRSEATEGVEHEIADMGEPLDHEPNQLVWKAEVGRPLERDRFERSVDGEPGPIS
jgi:hypothetical protein